MSNVSIRIKGAKEAQRKLRQFRQAVKQGRSEPVKVGCDKAIHLIKRRTLSGNDVNGKPFIPYSDRYKARKRKTVVNLMDSFTMLGGITSQAWAKRGRIYLKGGDPYKLGLVHNNGGRSGRGTGFEMPKREFMGVNIEDEKNEVYGDMFDWWSNYAKEIGL